METLPPALLSPLSHQAWSDAPLGTIAPIHTDSDNLSSAATPVVLLLLLFIFFITSVTAAFPRPCAMAFNVHHARDKFLACTCGTHSHFHALAHKQASNPKVAS